jgi:hypothetical protein
MTTGTAGGVTTAVGASGDTRAGTVAATAVLTPAALLLRREIENDLFHRFWLRSSSRRGRGQFSSSARQLVVAIGEAVEAEFGGRSFVRTVGSGRVYRDRAGNADAAASFRRQGRHLHVSHPIAECIVAVADGVPAENRRHAVWLLGGLLVLIHEDVHGLIAPSKIRYLNVLLQRKGDIRRNLRYYSGGKRPVEDGFVDLVTLRHARAILDRAGALEKAPYLGEVLGNPRSGRRSLKSSYEPFVQFCERLEQVLTSHTPWKVGEFADIIASRYGGDPVAGILIGIGEHYGWRKPGTNTSIPANEEIERKIALALLDGVDQMRDLFLTRDSKYATKAASRVAERTGVAVRQVLQNQRQVATRQMR